LNVVDSHILARAPGPSAFCRQARSFEELDNKLTL
jgi:hypothetical protein